MGREARSRCLLRAGKIYLILVDSRARGLDNPSKRDTLIFFFTHGRAPVFSFDVLIWPPTSTEFPIAATHRVYITPVVACAIVAHRVW